MKQHPITEEEKVVVALISLCGNEIVGRTRFQKQAYLLDRCGADFGFRFVYHHYGPYSFDLADGWIDASAEGRITINEYPGRYGILYSIFRTDESVEPPSKIGKLSAEIARKQLEKMKGVSDIVLELAATIAFFRAEGYDEQRAVEETRLRKSIKAGNGRLEKAQLFLKELGLGQEVVTA